ncbi:MAG TPA: hypothetical protein VLQ47_03070 [Rhodoferax sp.]|nr:hypothetical protein [Rhodoferax sp.]
MPNLIPHEAITELLSFRGPTCLSLYQPTHRNAPDLQQNAIRFRQLVRQLASSLDHQACADARRLLEPFEALGHDAAFWEQALDGLAVMGGLGLFRVYKLQRAVPELAMVEDNFQSAVFLNRWTETECWA